MNIARMLEASVDRHPHSIALVFDGHHWTYSEWFARIQSFAKALSNLGVRPGDRVAFYVSNSENSVTTYFACQMLSAVAVPINYRLSSGEVVYLLQDSGARILIYGRYLTENVNKVQAQIRSVHDFISCAYDPQNVPDEHLHFDTLVKEAVVSDVPWAGPNSTDISALVYTSGTTGRPKGVIHTHANDMAIAMNCVMEYGLNHNDKALHVAPLYHVGGMQAYFIPHLMVGATNVIIGRYEVENTLKTIQAERITTLFVVPAQIQEMLFHKKFDRFDISSLRLVTTGGAAILAATMEHVIATFCPNIYNGYGMTEASLSLVLHPRDALRKLGSCGKPTLISECKLIALGSNREVSPTETVKTGEIGQLIVRGPQTMSGYWNKPFETSKKLKGDWFFTGDLFSKDDEGFYFFHGRADDLIVSGGENIYPREVEELLYRCPGVKDAAVIGLPDPKWGAVVTAFIVAADVDICENDLDSFCKSSEALASFKRPKRYVFLKKLPTNPSGKIIKTELTKIAMR